jgi:hypothetical protein
VATAVAEQARASGLAQAGQEVGFAQADTATGTYAAAPGSTPTGESRVPMPG